MTDAINKLVGDGKLTRTLLRVAGVELLTRIGLLQEGDVHWRLGDSAEQLPVRAGSAIALTNKQACGVDCPVLLLAE